MRSRELIPAKSLTYFALLEAFSKSGCPVCRLMEEHSRRYLDALFYEQVNDVGVRRKLRATRGFCNWHTWQVAKSAGSALGVAIIAKDLVIEEIARLDNLLHRSLATRLQRPVKIPATCLRAFIQGWRQKRICPACEILHEHERHAIETILSSLDEAEFARRLENSAPLCVIHTVRVAKVDGAHPHFRTLIEMQRRKYVQLVGELQELCRKHDHRFSHEPWGAESNSWLRAIELLVGKPGVFGNEIHRNGSTNGTGRWWSRLFDCYRSWIRGQATSTSVSGESAKEGELNSGRLYEEAQGSGKE